LEGTLYVNRHRRASGYRSNMVELSREYPSAIKGASSGGSLGLWGKDCGSLPSHRPRPSPLPSSTSYTGFGSRGRPLTVVFKEPNLFFFLCPRLKDKELQTFALLVPGFSLTSIPLSGTGPYLTPSFFSSDPLLASARHSDQSFEGRIREGWLSAVSEQGNSTYFRR